MARGVTWEVERAVARAASEGRLWSPGATLVVGVSGGADSLCLLGALHALLERHERAAPGRLVVAHLNHGLRGEAGTADAEWVRDFAASLGCEFALGEADVAAEARTSGRSQEDAARVARYAFLRTVRRESDAERVCVGHTSDDQLETIVMSWLRGSGLAGLSGMSPLDHDIARPLLTIARKQTEGYCAARGWEPRADATNTDRRFRRNRVRLDLLPVLRDYNPNLRETALRNAALLADDEAYLDAVSAEQFRLSARPEGEQVVAFALDDLLSASAAIRRRLVQRACAHLTASVRPLEATHVLAVDRLLSSGTTGDELALPGQLRARRDYDTLLFERRVATSPGQRAPSSELCWRLQVPGSVDLSDIGWRLRAWLVTVPPGLERDPEPFSPSDPFARRGTAAELRRAELRVYVDAEKVGDALDVRLWRPGDRFQPLGTPFDKKVQDFFVDAKVPRVSRGRIPLVFGRDHLIWVGGMRIDDRVKLTSASQRILTLQLEPLADGAVESGSTS